MSTAFGLYKAKVIRALMAAGYKHNAEEFADCLDMSFEEVKHLHHTEWSHHINRDLNEYRKENPHEFEIKH